MTSTSDEDSPPRLQRAPLRPPGHEMAINSELISLRQRLGFCLGHVLNDLCASMWFTYLLLFFHRVLQFDNVYAGVIMFTGQIADGISTLFVGYFSDRDAFPVCDRYGRRKAWHLVGTLCVLISFPFIFSSCLGCSQAHQKAQIVYYCAFVVIFQFGWAATQISHLAIIPEMSPLTSERTGLTSKRFAATVASNVTVYALAWLYLGMGNGGDGQVGPDDEGSFRAVMFTVILVGTLTSLAFHVLVRPRQENAINASPNETASDNGRDDDAGVERMTVLAWLKEPQFYQIAFVYMTTRLFINLSQGYMPIYLQVMHTRHAEYAIDSYTRR